MARSARAKLSRPAIPPTGGPATRRRRVTRGFRTTEYQRPLLQRLTPLSWLLIALACLALVSILYLVVNQAANSYDIEERLSERLARVTVTGASNASRPVVVAPATVEDATATPSPTSSPTPSPVVAARVAEPTLVKTPPRPVLVPPPTPTIDPLGAEWRDQLTRLPDGTLMAPDAVVARARSDTASFYVALRDLSLDRYLAKRDSLFADHFAGAALQGIVRDEKERKQYLMNRGGQFDIQVRDFSANGLSATAFISLRGWTNDVYDIETEQLIEEARREKDTVTIARILFERSTGRWKFAIISQIVEVNSP